jgi:hypothetical protein
VDNRVFKSINKNYSWDKKHRLALVFFFSSRADNRVTYSGNWQVYGKKIQEENQTNSEVLLYLDSNMPAHLLKLLFLELSLH